MGTILAADMLKRCQTLLLDKNNDRWTGSELLDWLNDGQRAVALYRPDASYINGSVQLVAGTKQTLPVGGLRLLDVIRNMGVDGATPGAPIRYIDRHQLDQLSPTWHTASSNNVAANYVFDGRYPKNFYVSPPQTTSPHKIEVVYSVSPLDVRVDGVDGETIDDPITLDDIYQGALVDYILYRAWNKDSLYKDENKANSHYTAFLRSLGVKVKVDKAFDPRSNAAPKAEREGARDATAF